MHDISNWSDATFGENQRNPAILYHLKKEVNELIESVELYEENKPNTTLLNDVKLEFADAFILLLDSAFHIGFTSEDIYKIIYCKLEINKSRKWGKPDENGVIEHIE